MLATSIGLLTILILSVYTFMMIRNRRFNLYSLTFTICSLFFLSCVSNSVLVNFYYQDIRGIQSPTDMYFWASRYQAMTAGFWVSIAFLIFCHLKFHTDSISKKFILIASVITIFSVTTSIEDEILDKSISQNSLDSSMARYILDPDNSKFVSSQILTNTFRVPESWSTKLQDYFEFLRSNRLGFWSNTEEFSSQLGIVGLTDSNWLNGKSRFDSRFLFFNTNLNNQKLNQSGVFNFLGEIYTVDAISEHGMYLHVNAHMVDSNSITSFTPVNLTDANWSNGVSRSETAFFISINTQNVSLYKVGTKIKFGSGVRTVLSTLVSDSWLNVYLDGEPLNPTIDGYPNEFEFVK